MGFFIRKTKKMGLFNFNLSKSGIGASVGAMGIRTGIDSKGRVYISGGKGMFRYRKYLSTKNTTHNKTFEPNYNHLYDRSFLGVIWGIFQFVLDLVQFSMFIGIFLGVATTYPGSYAILITFILSIFCMVKIHKFIFTPYFIKMVNFAGVYIKRGDYPKALDILQKAKQKGYNSKLYKITRDFTVIIDNLIKICENQQENKKEKLEQL